MATKSPRAAPATHKTKVNLACGADVRSDHLNVDARPGPGIDRVFDLEKHPWPLPDAAFDEALASHILEHVRDPFGFMADAARILRPGGRLVVYVPHWKNPVATWGNFDHKRAIHPHAFQAFLPAGRNSADLLQQESSGRFASLTWGLGDRKERWGESRFLPGFLRIGKSRLGVFTHLWYRLRIRRFLQVEEVKVVLTRGSA